MILVRNQHVYLHWRTIWDFVAAELLLREGPGSLDVGAIIEPGRLGVGGVGGDLTQDLLTGFAHCGHCCTYLTGYTLLSSARIVLAHSLILEL